MGRRTQRNKQWKDPNEEAKPKPEPNPRHQHRRRQSDDESTGPKLNFFASKESNYRKKPHRNPNTRVRYSKPSHSCSCGECSFHNLDPSTAMYLEYTREDLEDRLGRPVSNQEVLDYLEFAHGGDDDFWETTDSESDDYDDDIIVINPSGAGDQAKTDFPAKNETGSANNEGKEGDDVEVVETAGYRALSSRNNNHKDFSGKRSSVF